MSALIFSQWNVSLLPELLIDGRVGHAHWPTSPVGTVCLSLSSVEGRRSSNVHVVSLWTLISCYSSSSDVRLRIWGNYDYDVEVHRHILCRTKWMLYCVCFMTDGCFISSVRRVSGSERTSSPAGPEREPPAPTVVNAWMGMGTRAVSDPPLPPIQTVLLITILGLLWRAGKSVHWHGLGRNTCIIFTTFLHCCRRCSINIKTKSNFDSWFR